MNIFQDKINQYQIKQATVANKGIIQLDDVSKLRLELIIEKRGSIESKIDGLQQKIQNRQLAIKNGELQMSLIKNEINGLNSQLVDKKEMFKQLEQDYKELTEQMCNYYNIMLCDWNFDVNNGRLVMKELPKN